MRKEELTPEEKKRLLEVEELKKEIIDNSNKFLEKAEKFCKRIAAYAIVKSMPDEKPPLN